MKIPWKQLRGQCSVALVLVISWNFASGLTNNLVERRLLVLGLGPVGRTVAAHALTRAGGGKDKDVCGGFEEVYGTVRSFQEDASGIRQLLFSRENIVEVLPRCTHVLVTIPPQPQDARLSAVYNDMECHLSRNTWVGFVSTTGVYGNHDGAWVTEESSLHCQEGSQAARFRDAEEMWKQRARANNWNLSVFRCAGIYGPRRSALHTLYRNGYTPDLVPPSQQSVTNRIHEVDIARAIVASMSLVDETKEPGYRVYNVADDEPTARSVVMQYAEKLLRSHGMFVKIQKDDTSPVSERSQRRQTDQKQVSNERMRVELLNDYGGLTYPTFREGLAAILPHPTTPWSDIKAE